MPALLVGLIALLLLLGAGTFLVLRWLRWHFLARRLGLYFHTRESLRWYAVTAPLLVVPAFLGELLRSTTVTRRETAARRSLLLVWVLERPMDAVALGAFWLVVEGGKFSAAAVLLAGWVVSWLAVVPGERRLGNPRPRRDAAIFAAAALGASVGAWAVPFFAWRTFPLALGGLVASLAALGMVVAVLSRRRLRPLSAETNSDHFDDLAPDYGSEIPEHMRQRLLRRKIDVMLSYFAARGCAPAGLSGLDFGCGQGWYAVEMAQSGVAMAGTDASAGQVEMAREIARSEGVELDLRHNAPGRIPFDDDSFDFVYTVNVLHHVLDDADRAGLFAELDRVLRPGGVVFLHEINTLNPVFRFYMSYVFPLVRRIDVGNERWINPLALPKVPGGRWRDELSYYTFVPDFVPSSVMAILRPVESLLERSPVRHLSAHYTATFEKAAG